MEIQANKEELKFITHDFLSEYSFEKIHEMLGALYKGWTLRAADYAEREERIKMLIFVDELKQFFEKIEAEN